MSEQASSRWRQAGHGVGGPFEQDQIEAERAERGADARHFETHRIAVAAQQRAGPFQVAARPRRRLRQQGVFVGQAVQAGGEVGGQCLAQQLVPFGRRQARHHLRLAVSG